MKRLLGPLMVGAMACGMSALSARADSVLTFTGSGTGPDTDTVAATAVFTISNGQVQLVLTNTTATTKSAGDLLTQISFSIAGGKSVTSESAASAADVINFPTKGSSSYNDLGPQNLLTLVPAQWELVATNTLSWNGGGDPNYGILGPGPYSSANNSIEGNGPHNPFIAQSASFTLVGGSIVSTDTINSVQFYFGTGPDLAFTVSTGTPSAGTPVPLPLAFWSGGALLAGLGLFRTIRKVAH